MSTSHPAPMARRTAIVILACRDYAALELALASQMAYRPPGVPFFVLQNCRGGYDAERTLGVARRYERLFPGVVKVVDDIVPGDPYRSIKKLLSKPEFAEIDLVCKIDDDAFPITHQWLDHMLEAYGDAEQESGGKLAYVTPLINNNGWGFPQVMKVMNLEQEYFATQAHPHFVGTGKSGRFPLRIIPAEQIETGTNGTIWGYPHIARWLHERTTLQPDAFIAATQALAPCDVPAQSRYSIGCILFRKPLWDAIDDGGHDDEHMMHMYCERNDLRIVCVRRVPFVHLAFFTQREENRDIVDAAHALYGQRLGHPFPLTLYADRERENEARLRWLEQRLTEPSVTKRKWLQRIAPKRVQRAVRRRLVWLWQMGNGRSAP
ncbi:hypothetical protein B0G57_11288 [Trinickia symbiotica]|uniref:Uncharacterized protein n=1 Tax=Trinickia symbiotica TaxID=863227 RepID=A0A2N7X0D6_9BURK|nr:hypothetical protein [Trinickia symbiotica]PMS35042.1 hypothetical protein C0Z20_20045 [Trinickia symbiotica]PPK43541.1 hypothetical protein B0G57_11288 [Trinickia symbiotica]